MGIYLSQTRQHTHITTKQRALSYGREHNPLNQAIIHILSHIIFFAVWIFEYDFLFREKCQMTFERGNAFKIVLTSYLVCDTCGEMKRFINIYDCDFCFFSLCVFLFLSVLFIYCSFKINRQEERKKKIIWKERHEILVKIHEFMMNIIVMDAFIGVYQNACKLRKHHIRCYQIFDQKVPPKRYVNGRQQQRNKKTTTMTRDNQNVSKTKTKRTKLKWNGTHGYHAHLLSEEVTLLHCIDIC